MTTVTLRFARSAICPGLATIRGFVVLLLAVCVSSAIQAQQSTTRDVDGARLQRLLQYESLVGVVLPADTALCVDVALNSPWLLPATARQDLAPTVAERVRHAAEACEASRRPLDHRLASQLRSRSQQQLEAATWAEEKLPKARDCLALSADTAALRACVTEALGAPPSDADWRRWTALFERRRR